MRLYSRRALCLLVAAITGAVPAAIPLHAAPAAAGHAPAPAAGRGTFRDITLITGDRLSVAVDGSNRIAVRPAPGRENVGFVRKSAAGRLTVVPNDALPLIRAGRLDQRLFDVTRLLADGYDDARSAALPLIVESGGAAAVRLEALRDTTAVRALPAVNGTAVALPRGAAGSFWNRLAPARSGVRTMSAGIGRVWLDAKLHPALDVSVPQIGAPAAWAAGFTGKGVPVAVLDTGIDATHPDLAGRVADARNFAGDGPVVDDVGHGTHVASIVTGTGAASGGRHRGVAPDVQLYDGKVCGGEDCAESAILAGMQWAAADKRARVVNMSLGGPDQPGVDPLEQAVETLTARHGTLFVVAAGNDGPREHTLGSPGTADAALTVGAVDSKDDAAPFSSRGPRVGDDALKPDVTAPGVGIVAARSKDTTLPAPPVGPDGRYLKLDGTSMAAPHVAGAVAILAQQHPDWTPARLKATLMASAQPTPMLSGHVQGAGRIDLTRALRQTVTVNAPSVSFGRQPWPHADDRPVTRAVTYHNAGPTPVTLTLTTSAAGPDGKPLAARLFTVSRPTVTVPAGGDAGVAVTVHTRIAVPDGYLTGAVVATAGDTVVRLPVAVNREAQSYDLTIRHLDRAGKAATEAQVDVVRLDRPGTPSQGGSGGTVKLRLPKGRYAVISAVRGSRGDRTMLVQPLLTLDRARTSTMDARRGRPLSVRVPRAGAKQRLAVVGVSVGPVERATVIDALSQSFTDTYTAQVGPDNRRDTVVAQVQGQWGEPENTPYLYAFSHYDRLRFPTGMRRTLTTRDLAAVRVDLGSAVPGARGSRELYPALAGRLSGAYSATFTHDLPSVRTEYYNADAGVRWSSQLSEVLPATKPDDPPRTVAQTNAPFDAYRAGRTYRQVWNRGVFGPSVAAQLPPFMVTARLGNQVAFQVPVFADSAARPQLSLTDSGGLTVHRDGAELVRLEQPAGEFTLPAADGAYTVTAQATRGTPFQLSTRVSATWAFRSGHVEGKVPKALPVMTVRFTPPLSATSTATARAITIPVVVDRQGTAGEPRSLTVQVSFDDGATWRPMTVAGGRIRVEHPAGHGFVSLKAAAADAAGNRVEQTVIRAYRF